MRAPAALAAALTAAALATVAPAQAVDDLPADAGWLETVNYYRTGSGLPPVSDNAAWSAGISAHLRYLALTPQSYRTGQYANAHTENPASPYYTPEGDQAGRSSNLGYGRTEREAIEGWMRAPFHAIGILRPQLTQAAFAAREGAAGLDVIRGLGQTDHSGPVLFPGNGSRVSLSSFTGELPNPLETCGYTAPAGLPLIAMLPSDVSPDATAELTGPDGRTLASTGSDLRLVTEHTFRTSDSVYGGTGAGILAGDNAAFLIARRPLAVGTYTARLLQPGQDPITWSFERIAPPVVVRNVMLWTARLGITLGNAPIVTGTVVDTEGRPVDGAVVTLRQRRYGETAWTPVDTGGLRTSPEGEFRMTLRPDRQTSYVFTVGGVSSEPMVFTVAPRMAITAPAANATVGRATAFTGTHDPQRPGVPIGLAVFRDGRFVVLAQARTDAAGRFVIGTTLPRGTATYMVFTSARDGLTRGAKSVRVTVT